MAAAAKSRVALVVDFEAILADIRATGRSFAQISEATGISKSALVMLGCGSHSEPRHHTGERLVTFWCLRTGKPRELLPTVERYQR